MLFKLGRQGLGSANWQARDLVEVGVEHVQATFDAQQQADSGLFADTGHAGNVVDLVAHQREEVDDVLRTDTKFLLHASNIHHASGHGIDQRNVPVDQLRHVLVTRGNDHRAACCGAAACQGTDDIVSLDTVNAEQGIA
ncbi:hypothetical protein D9M71_184720 [compost metagenome]